MSEEKVKIPSKHFGFKGFNNSQKVLEMGSTMESNMLLELWPEDLVEIIQQQDKEIEELSKYKWMYEDLCR